MTTATTTATDSTSGISAYLKQQDKNIATDKNTIASTGTTSGTDAASVRKSYNTFLKLLTTQLQHQDPTSATDTNQFTQELVQYSQVEQQLSTNEKLDTLINLQKGSSGATAALNYIGKYVEAPANGQFPIQGGKTEFGYTISSAAKSAIVSVTDQSGTTVATFNAPTKTGLNYVSWDGKDSSGNQLSDGTYKFSLVVTGTDNKAENITDTRIIGKVTGVDSNSDGTINLNLGDGLSVTQNSVDSVFDANSLPSATAATKTASGS
jgi:flagellar basal-body rod modification protein FlgD